MAERKHVERPIKIGGATKKDEPLPVPFQLNVDFRKYRVLGACNPAYAYKALQMEDKVGTMLPCSVIVQELGDNEIEVAAVDPIASMMAIENPALAEIAGEIKQKLERAIASL